MIPVIPAQDLEAYPSFAAAWAHITGQLLEADGSSRRANEARARNWGLKVRRARVGGGGGRGSELGTKPRLEEENDDDDEGEGDDDDGEAASQTVRDGEEKRSSSGLEEVLRAVRVRGMKDGILREILSEVAYLEDEGAEPGRIEQSSRIPIPVLTHVATTGQDRGNNTVTNKDAGDEALRDPTSATNRDIRLLPRLRDLVLIISAYLDATTTPVDLVGARQEELLAEDIELFRANILHIAAVVSSRVTALESSLSALADLAPGCDVASRRVPSSLSSSLQVQVEKLNTLRTTALPSSLTRLASTLHSLLSLQRTLLHLQITHLESSKHGVLSRYDGARVAFLSTVAQTMALKTQVLVLGVRREVDMTPETEEKRGFARARFQQMEKEERELDERLRVLEGVVDEYERLDPGGKGAAGIEVMTKLGRRYGEIEAEMETVKRDIEMLERKAEAKV
ncbi:hypothetical protein PV04_10525 [Phialophora macrospora]|uniref:Uncharacterized protein n=1 Tax=Phialophora macrospora TaxID=1851006 RepID=A0A0D2FQQ3_9EURO|nr:hypothetical protein PV04_10525 [Phialophora macrospora]